MPSLSDFCLSKIAAVRSAAAHREAIPATRRMRSASETLSTRYTVKNCTRTRLDMPSRSGDTNSACT